MRSISLVALVITAALLVPSEARATDCPGVYSGLACNGGAANNICVLDGSGYPVCDLEANYAGTYAGSGVTSSHYVTPTANGAEFLAYGTDAIGNAFCCQLSMTQPGQCSGTVTVYGSGIADTIHLDDPAQGWNLTCTHATVWGSDDTDSLYGSNATNNVDALHGESSADLINGGYGDDYINGGVSADILNGGPGNDTIDGDNGNDVIDGGVGADVIDGGADDDDIRGGDGADEIDAGGGADEVCGDGGNDTILGGDGDDFIFAGTGTDTVDGEGGYDTCDQAVCNDTTLAACTL